MQKWQYPPSSIVWLVGDWRRTTAKHGVEEDIGKERAKSDELEALSQPHPAYHEDEMGGNVGDEEDSDILDVGDCLWGRRR